MYYDRTLSLETSALLEQNGKLRWLFDFVKSHEELDFLIGKNNSNEWLSIYRGLSRILTINRLKRLPNIIKISAAAAYEALDKKQNIQLYGKRDVNENFIDKITAIINEVRNDKKFDRYYINKKEGYFQNILSRSFGICGEADDNFVILDKEAVVGYKDTAEKNKEFGKFQYKYKALQKEISRINAKRFGSNLEKKALGNELDFLALDKEGNILLIEYKHGTNTSGIYLSPLQIGLYYDIFSEFMLRNPKKFEESIYSMLNQRQKIGLINSDWHPPAAIKGILPVLIISKYNEKTTAKNNFFDILKIARNELLDKSFLSDLQIYQFSENNDLELLSW